MTSLSIGEVFKDPHRETPSFEEGIRREDTVPLSMATKGLKLQTRNDHGNSTGKVNKPRKTIHYSSPAKDRAHTLKGSHEEVKKARLKSEGPDFQFYASTSAVKLATENAARSQSQTVEACLNKNRGDLEAKGSSLSITAPSFEAAGLHNPLRGLASASCATAESAPTHIDEMNTPSHNIYEVMDDSKIIPIAYTSGDDDFKGSVNLYDTTSEANLLLSHQIQRQERPSQRSIVSQTRVSTLNPYVSAIARG